LPIAAKFGLLTAFEEGIAPVTQFPEYPGSPQHASYDRFNAAPQLVSTSGDRAWIAPVQGDVRDPCAELSAAANHSYNPRDGIATAEAINTGLWEAFGLDKTVIIFPQTATMFFRWRPIV
jgi:hypothetical protein